MVIYFITNCIHIIQKNIMCFAPMAYFTGRMHKKRNNEKINFVFLEDIGKPVVEKVDIDSIISK